MSVHSVSVMSPLKQHAGCETAACYSSRFSARPKWIPHKKLFASVPFYCKNFCLVIVMNLLAANIFNHKCKKQKSIIHNVNNDALVFNKSLVYISDLK